MEELDKSRYQLKKLRTPFGNLYIEPWDMPRNAKYRESYITIFDSRKKWFDHFSLDYFYDGCYEEGETSEDEDIVAEQEYINLCEMLELGAEVKTLDDFLDWLCFDYDYAGPDREKAELVLSDGHPEELLPDEVETSEFVLHLGENYIVVRDY